MRAAPRAMTLVRSIRHVQVKSINGINTHNSNHHELIIPANAYSITANREAQTDHLHGAGRIYDRIDDGILSWRDVDGFAWQRGSH
jgi:hypothetical protein